MKKFLLAPVFVLLFAATAVWAADGEKIFTADCAGCHGMAGEKGANPLKGQGSEEILKKLQGYANGSYGGEKKSVMGNIAKKHADNLKSIAEYIGTLQ